MSAVDLSYRVFSPVEGQGGSCVVTPAAQCAGDGIRDIRGRVSKLYVNDAMGDDEFSKAETVMKVFLAANKDPAEYMVMPEQCTLDRLHPATQRVLTQCEKSKYPEVTAERQLHLPLITTLQDQWCSSQGKRMRDYGFGPMWTPAMMRGLAHYCDGLHILATTRLNGALYTYLDVNADNMAVCTDAAGVLTIKLFDFDKLWLASKGKKRFKVEGGIAQYTGFRNVYRVISETGWPDKHYLMKDGQSVMPDMFLPVDSAKALAEVLLKVADDMAERASAQDDAAKEAEAKLLSDEEKAANAKRYPEYATARREATCLRVEPPKFDPRNVIYPEEAAAAAAKEAAAAEAATAAAA